eukprot:2175322-Amphidinium_carterae.1
MGKDALHINSNKDDRGGLTQQGSIIGILNTHHGIRRVCPSDYISQRVDHVIQEPQDQEASRSSISRLSIRDATSVEFIKHQRAAKAGITQHSKCIKVD